jgi:choline kinase/mannose-6-phosphate isomerase-like protein (cupin superfamily)/thiamine kinase-like enzyme
MSKVIYKPWGKEEWLELNDKYCYKRIYINAGTKTSYQYHDQKLETNYIIEGTAEVWLENDEGVVEKKIMKAGEFFTVEPPKKHRVIAITDIILQEVSTPEVDDVIRISDDSGRGSGKIEHEHMKPALCILAAGIGSRLENFSEHINKGLLPLDNKAIISHLIYKIPEDYEIVVVLGYKGEMVEEYCKTAHSDRNFIFVTVDKYEGKETGPGYSIKQAKEYLQRPFIWTTADTVITDDIPTINNNWLGVYPTSVPELYSTANVEDGKVIDFKNKSKGGYGHAFIGLAGVYDYKIFWNQLDIQENSEWVDRKGKTHGEGSEIVSAYHDISAYPRMEAKQFDWYDVGTVDNYIKSQRVFENSVTYSIPKTNGEFLYKVNDNFIKLSSDKKFINGRIERAKKLGQLVPRLVYSGNSLYSYKWLEGSTLYDCNDVDVWIKFLDFIKDKMWTPINTDIKNDCLKFYKDKTMDRLDKFLLGRDKSYLDGHVVNGGDTGRIKSMLQDFKWNIICDGIATEVFHGDLQFDNVIYTPDREFYLLDWRQDFAGQIIGDVYYDLSKMYGGILMSYKLMKDSNNFSCYVDDEMVTYDYKSESKLNEFKLVYEKWIIDNGYNLNKVKNITSLIFLNMAPLHEKEFGDLLFFKSKEMIQEVNG